MIYILRKIITDNANTGFAVVWNQQSILASELSYNDFLKSYKIFLNLKNKSKDSATKIIDFGNIVCLQKPEESESEFLLRAAIKGYRPDFELQICRDPDWTEHVFNVINIR